MGFIENTAMRHREREGGFYYKDGPAEQSLCRYFFLSFFAATSADFAQGATVVAGADTRNVASMPGDDGRALLSAMQKDTDIAAEAASLQQAMRRLEVGEVELQPPAASTAPTGSVGPPLRHVRLNWYPNQGGHQPNNETRRLLQEVGGTEALAHFTQR